MLIMSEYTDDKKMETANKCALAVILFWYVALPFALVVASKWF
jgi:hypothetical protein